MVERDTDGRRRMLRWRRESRPNEARRQGDGRRQGGACVASKSFGILEDPPQGRKRGKNPPSVAAAAAATATAEFVKSGVSEVHWWVSRRREGEWNPHKIKRSTSSSYSQNQRFFSSPQLSCSITLSLSLSLMAVGSSLSRRVLRKVEGGKMKPHPTFFFGRREAAKTITPFMPSPPLPSLFPFFHPFPLLPRVPRWWWLLFSSQIRQPNSVKSPSQAPP